MKLAGKSEKGEVSGVRIKKDIIYDAFLQKFLAFHSIEGTLKTSSSSFFTVISLDGLIFIRTLFISVSPTGFPSLTESFSLLLTSLEDRTRSHVFHLHGTHVYFSLLHIPVFL